MITRPRRKDRVQLLELRSPRSFPSLDSDVGALLRAYISKAEILVFQKDDIYRILTYTNDTLKHLSMVGMQISETTDLEALNGKKAIEALCDYVEELEKQRGKHLTGKQTDAMIRLATELISSIESGMRDSIEGGDLILHGRIVRAQLRANAALLRQQSPAPL